MSDHSQAAGPRLPIKMILPNQGRHSRVPGGSNKAKPFRDVSASYRGSLRNQVQAIEQSIAALPASRKGPVPVKVSLIPQALAKSHRPKKMFTEKTCPIVGAGGAGVLFLKGSPLGLQAIGEMLENETSAQGLKEISSIESIEPITPEFRRHRISSLDILRHSPRVEDGFLTRVRLFDFGGFEQKDIVDEFLALCQSRNIRLDQTGYNPNSFTWSAECRTADDVDAVSRVVGVRSLTCMPKVQVIHPRVLNPSPLLQPLPAKPDEDLPSVVVVDSGISSDVPNLESWVLGRDSVVAQPYRNEEHGTFVAGLICWGADLNPNLADINGSPCAVFDLQVIPNSDPEKGDVDSLTEQELLQALDTALQNHANRFKVWNLSLSSNDVCSLDEFSPLAAELDNLQEKYQVSFVISAGNYNKNPLLDFPRTKEQLEIGRITSPADSVLGITVGSISHIEYDKKGPDKECLSPFSRHGAGPNHIIKPDLVHYGGTCSTDLSHTSGVKSVAGNHSAEDLGTSFSTPLVSRTLAQIYHEITPTPSPVLARALLTHHARDPRTGGRVADGDENYFGFGRPMPPPYCLECSPHSSTLVFEDYLRPGFFLEWDNFPYPRCLQKDGRFYGEVWMTIAFAPTRGARWGSEYCESHIEANFGVYREVKSQKTGKTRAEFKGLVPPEHKNKGALYESFQVEKLRKWAPVRTYYGNLEKGERGLRWRLKLRLLSRHGIDQKDIAKPQTILFDRYCRRSERKSSSL